MDWAGIYFSFIFNSWAHLLTGPRLMHGLIWAVGSMLRLVQNLHLMFFLVGPPDVVEIRTKQIKGPD
jgi:hypothetical protein